MNAPIRPRLSLDPLPHARLVAVTLVLIFALLVVIAAVLR